MPRDLPLGNGKLLVAYDLDGRIRDFYYPRVGQENHAQGYPFRWGFFTEGKFSWVSAKDWSLKRRYLPETLSTDLRGENPVLGVSFRSRDVVDFHETVYVRRLTVQNEADHAREIRVFFHHDFRIRETDVGDTALFDPSNRTIVHYKQDRYFLINLAVAGKAGIPTWACGQKGPGKEGTWKDAEDGALSGNPIAQGAVDSTIGVTLLVGARAHVTFDYWIVAATSWTGAWDSAATVNEKVLSRGAESFCARTEAFWRAWVNKEQLDFGDLPPELVDLYKRSLLVLRTQIDDGGAIIAANDSDIAQFARDTYSYLWPRDGALVAEALARAGYSETARRFFVLCGDLIHPDGYFAHKFTPEGRLASSWHPWTQNGERQLPIQEDETALVLWALWKYYNRSRDVDVFKPLYGKIVRRAADFLCTYRDAETGLPAPSWDLWEERWSVSAFAVGAVLGGLKSAVRFAEGVGDRLAARRWKSALMEIKAASDRYLWRPELNRFARAVTPHSGDVEVDGVVDTALYGIWAFGGYAADDPRVISTMAAVEGALAVKTPVGGIARYENDYYHRKSDKVPGNPWFLGTLWMARHEIALAKSDAELHEKVIPRLTWTRERALPSGVLAEQLDPETGEPLSVSPLTWSHATVVDVVQHFIERREALSRCPTCGRSSAPKYRDRSHIGLADATAAIETE